MKTKTKNEITRVNLDISGELKADLDDLCQDSTESRSEVIRRAIRVLHRLSLWRCEGGMITLEKPDGSEKRIVELL